MAARDYLCRQGKYHSAVHLAGWAGIMSGMHSREAAYFSHVLIMTNRWPANKYRKLSK